MALKKKGHEREWTDNMGLTLKHIYLNLDLVQFFAHLS